MDPMGGVVLKATLNYNTGEQETDTNQSHFSVIKVDNQNSTSYNLYITGTATTSIGNVTVVNNQVNKDWSNKLKSLDITYNNGTITKDQKLSVTQTRYYRICCYNL